MTGLERNAEVVHMASYAPLFAHVEGWQWTPDLVWYDNLRSYGTPDYYVQQLYSLNKGTDVVPVTLHDQTVTGQDGCFASAVLDKNTHMLIIKFINTGAQSQDAHFVINGAKGLSSTGSLTTLQSNDLNAVNSLAEPGTISPQVQAFSFSGDTVRLRIKPYSVNVIRVEEGALIVQGDYR
jgi:alpha-N-arabinofuranosidase